MSPLFQVQLAQQQAVSSCTHAGLYSLEFSLFVTTQSRYVHGQGSCPYHSCCGHIEAMAKAIAEGAREVADATVDVNRVPETVPPEVLKSAGGKADQAAPIAQPAELANYDAIIFPTPKSFGNISGQMRNFLDQTGGLWMNGSLVGKVGSVFASSAMQHGGHEISRKARGNDGDEAFG